MGVDKLKIHLISVFLKLPHICKIDKTPSKLACRQNDLQKRLYIEIMLSHDQKIYINLDRYGEQTLLLWTIPNLITASVFHIHLILNIASCFYNHENASWRFLYCSIWSIYHQILPPTYIVNSEQNNHVHLGQHFLKLVMQEIKQKQN